MDLYAILTSKSDKLPYVHHPYLMEMVHSCRLRLKADGIVTTQRFHSKAVRGDMPERVREKHERETNGIETQTHGVGGRGIWNLGLEFQCQQITYKRTRFRILALFIPFSSKLKFSHAYRESVRDERFADF